MIPFKKTMLGVLAVAGVGTGAFWYFSNDHEPIPELGGLYDLVYARVADQVASKAVIPDDGRAIFVPSFQGDGKKALRPWVGDRLRRKGAQVLIPMEEVGEAPDWLGMAGEGGSIIDWDWLKQLVSEKKERADIVLGGRMKLIDDDDKVRVELSWLQVDQEKQGVMVARTETTEEVAKSWFSTDYQVIRISESSRPLRFSLWVLALVVPALLATPFIGRALKEDSNLKNALMVLGFAIPGAIGAWVLTAYGTGWWGGMLTFMGILMSAAFSFLYCTILEARR